MVQQDPLDTSSRYQNSSLFFNDGERSIDFVLVWQSKPDVQSHEDLRLIKRSIFEENLTNEGLDIEHEIYEDLHFIKVRNLITKKLHVNC